jgi:hypothetical protein
VQETADSGFIIAGNTTITSGPGGPDTDVYLLKTDANGDSVWAQTYELNPTEEYRDYGYSVQQTSDGGYIVVGETWYPGTPAWEIDVYLVKTHPNGDTMWTRTYDRAGRTDVGNDVQQTGDGGYIIAGQTQIIGLDDDFYLIRTDSNGDTVWTKTFGDSQAPTPWEEAFALDQTSDGGYILAGFTHSYGAGNSDVWIVKTAPEPGIAEHESTHPTPFSLHVSPNPFTYLTDIRYQITDNRKTCELKVYDITGRQVADFSKQISVIGNQSSVKWDGTDNSSRKLPSGIYFVKLKAGGYTTTKTTLFIR